MPIDTTYLDADSDSILAARPALLATAQAVNAIVAGTTPAGNSSQLLGSTWAAPAAIGSGTPAAGSFTTLSATGAITGSTYGLRLPTNGPIYLNVGLATYIQELSANVIQVVVGSANIAQFSATGLEVTGLISATGIIKPILATTAGAPSYVKGAIYFDTTLNKLRVGGATAWETITST